MNRMSLLLLVALAPFLRGPAGTAAASPAEESLAAKLGDLKIRTGYDRSRGRLVFVGSVSRDVANPASDDRFQEIRRRAYEVAEFKARHALMDYVEKDVTASESVAGYLNGGEAGARTVSRFTTVSSMELIACVPICSAESHSDGNYSVAVAVGWSAEAERLARMALKRKGCGDTGRAELEAWLKQFDLALLQGSRQFADGRGGLYQIGVGAADVEGLRGLRLRSAMRKADLQAVRNLAYALCVPVCGRKEIASAYERSSDAAGDEESVAASFTARVEGKVSALRLPGVFRVRDATVRHPISGRSLYVSVYGLAIGDAVATAEERR